MKNYTMNKKQQYLITAGGLAVVVLIILAIVMWGGGSSDRSAAGITQMFYDEWTSERNPIAQEYYKDHPLLVGAFAASIPGRLEGKDEGYDLFVCGTEDPDSFEVRNIFTNAAEGTAQTLVLLEFDERKVQTIVSLESGQEGWLISGIDCPSGANSESAPENSGFNQEGTLVLNEPNLVSGTWYLRFDAPGSPNLDVPLLFDQNSTCVSRSGVESRCQPGTFSAGSRARVQGDLSELALTVTRLEFIE